MDKSSTASALQAVSQEIMSLEVKGNDTLNSLMKQFYAIMRKHGIAQGTWTDNGASRRCNNFEWTICLTLFRNRVMQSWEINMLFAHPPKDLMAYGSQPKKQPRPRIKQHAND